MSERKDMEKAVEVGLMKARYEVGEKNHLN